MTEPFSKTFTKEFSALKAVVRAVEPRAEESEDRQMSNTTPTEKTHWPCACVKRDAAGNLKAIKLHPNSVQRCRVCGARQSTLNQFDENGKRKARLTK